MAFMRPDYDPDEIPHDSEKLVYIALRDQLSNEYIVLHSYPWLRPNREGALREGEADFVILHRDRGMLVLEVKGGELRYRNGGWVRLLGNSEKPITVPFMQARKSMHTLVDRIEKHSHGDVLRSHFTYGYAVVFPHENTSDSVPPGADPAILITRRGMSQFQLAIETAFAKWPMSGQPMSQPQWNRLTLALLPEFKLYKPIAAETDSLHEKIQELTEEQLEVFRGFYEDNHRVYVTGVAGSGKTQIALDRAVHLAKGNLRTLFVCYNKHLADHLNALIRTSDHHKDCHENLKIRHFHGLAREYIEDAGMSWQPPEQDDKDDFFTQVVPAMMEQAAYLLLDQNQVVQFDAIVMDEAQDFHPHWWELLQNTLLKDPEAGIFYAFGDPVQRLWDWAPKEPPIPFATRFRLHRNCRNSRWIVKTSINLAATEAKVFKRAPVGAKPRIDVVPSPTAMKGAITASVQRLIEHDDLAPSQIVLMGPHARDNGSLAATKEIAGVALTDSIEKWQSGEGILVTTSRSFKGLETDVVVVYDLDRFLKFFTMIDLYVACTRARSHVHFLVTGFELVEAIRQAIATAELEFD